MNIKIKEILDGSYDPITKAVYDYTIIAELESGNKIKIFDYQGLNLHDYIEKKISCLLYPWIDKEPPGFLIEGEFIGKIRLNQEWLKYDKSLELDAHYGIRSKDGIFLIDDRYKNEYNLKKGDSVKFYANRIDLILWHPY